MEKPFEVDQMWFVSRRMIKYLNGKNIKNHVLKLTSSHVKFLFYFHFRAKSWRKLLVRSCELSSAPSLQDVSSSTWERGCSLREGCQGLCESDTIPIQSLCCWTTQETSSWGLHSCPVFLWTTLHIKHLLILFLETTDLMGKAKFNYLHSLLD